jgi:hypothetical protein
MTARAAPALSDGITLKDQWRLAVAVACDPRLARLDLAVLIVVLDRFYKAKGNSRASSRYLAEALGAERRNIRNSLRKLIALGYLEEARKGQGTRATEWRLCRHAGRAGRPRRCRVPPAAPDRRVPLQGTRGGDPQQGNKPRGCGFRLAVPERGGTARGRRRALGRPTLRLPKLRGRCLVHAQDFPPRAGRGGSR